MFFRKMEFVFKIGYGISITVLVLFIQSDTEVAGGCHALYAGHRGNHLFMEHSQVHGVTMFMDNCFYKQLTKKEKEKGKKPKITKNTATPNF